MTRARTWALVVAVLALTGCQGAPSAPAPTSGTPSVPTAAHGPLRATKGDGVTVAAPEHRDTYARTAYGRAWADVDHNGCDTRDDILARDMTDVVRAANGCDVESGTLDDPYTGHVYWFVRGPHTSAQVQIDHVVALADAWESGAWAWTPAQRLAYANDPANLLAVDGTQNMAKGSRDVAQWLPPLPAERCAYVLRYAATKAKYRLTSDPAEAGVLRDSLAQCPVSARP